MRTSSVYLLPVVVVCLLAAIIAIPAAAQMKTLQSELSGAALLTGSKSSTSLAGALTGEAYPVDNVVVPEYYYLGPGDILLLQKIDAMSFGPGEPLIVSPENTIVLPRFGEIDVRGKTLAEVKKEIQDSLFRRLPDTKVFITLQKPRTVYVTIQGNVAKPGLYALPASMSVVTAVRIANGELIDMAQKTMQVKSPLPSYQEIEAASVAGSVGGQYIGAYSERNTIVRHRDGSSHIADAIRAQVMGDPAADQMLREGDEIFVPYSNENYSLLSISGAVRRQAVVPYRTGDNVSFLLRLAYGLSDNADSSRVFLISPSGQRAAIDVAGAMVGTHDGPLEPGSSIVVEQKPSRTEVWATVAITGEVQSPGTYAITPSTTRLRDVVEQAGGFSSRAYLPLAYILRRGERSFQQNGTIDFYRNLQTNSLSVLDTTRYKLDMYMRRPVVAADFAAAFEKNSSADNVVLQSGDVIVVPEKPNNVYVFGQVTKAGFVAYEPGKTMQWYIQRAGGLSVDADEDRARIIKARTKLWIEGNDDTIVEAGDEIYIPRPVELPPGIVEQRYSTIAAFGGILVGIAGILANIFIFSR